MISIKDIADKLGMDADLVRRIILEVPGTKVDRETKDRIFQTARDIGFDTTKLYISKKMRARREAVEEVIKNIDANPDWGREEILEYLRYSVGLHERVAKKVMPEAYDEEKESE